MKKNVPRILLAAWTAVAAATAVAQQVGEGWERIGLLAGHITAIGVSPGYETDQTLYVGIKSGGLWKGRRSSNPSGLPFFSWQHMTAVPKGSTVTGIAFPSAYVHGSGTWMYVGTEDGYGYASSDDFATVGQSHLFTNVQSGLPVPVTDMEVLALDGRLYIATEGAGVLWSADNLTNVTPTSSMPTCINNTYALDSTSSALYAACFETTFGPSAKVHWYDSGGGGWSAAAALGTTKPGDLAIFDTVTSLIHGYAATGDGLFETSDAAGLSWSRVCGGGTSPFQAVDTCPQYTLDRGVFGGFAGSPFKTANKGTTCDTLPDYHAPVTRVAYSPGYHSGTYWDLFEGTEDGLYLVGQFGSSSASHNQPSSEHRIDTVAMASVEGGWAGSDDGLLRHIRSGRLLVYNAYEQFGGSAPDITSIALAPGFRQPQACIPASGTMFAALKGGGVLRSTNGGNSWSALTTGWPTGGVASDLAVSPQYATDSTVFAATDGGLYKWTGTTWSHVSTAASIVSIVAVPISYDDNATGNRWVIFWGKAVATSEWKLFFSTDGGATADIFNNATLTDCTAIAFSPDFNIGDMTFFVADGGVGPWFSSDANMHNRASFCLFKAGLSTAGLNIRDLAAAPTFAGGVLRLVAATEGGPFYLDFTMANDSTICGVTDTWFPSTFASAPSDLDSTAVAFGHCGSYTTMLGMAGAGIYWSSDDGITFDAGTGYNSLPNDTFSTVPHPLDDNVLFASSPSLGVFVSTTGGATFNPWNKVDSGAAFSCLEGAKGLGIIAARGCGGNDTLDVLFAGAPNASTDNQGIKMRWMQRVNGSLNLTYQDWKDTSVSAGSFERFETLLQGPSTEAWAASSTHGFYHSTNCNGSAWTQDAASPANASSVRFGNDRTPLTPLKNNSAASGQSVAVGGWKYYSIQIPKGTESCSIVLHPTAADPDLYVKYGALPTSTDYAYRSQNAGTTDDTACVYPATPGTWYIGVYGWSGSPAYDLTASIDLPCNILTDGVAKTGENVTYGMWNYYRIATLATDSYLQIDLNNITAGDPDLYVLRSEMPSQSLWTYRPFNSGTTAETVCIASPGAATWYIGVRGYATGTSIYDLTASKPSSCTPTPFHPGQGGGKGIAHGFVKGGGPGEESAPPPVLVTSSLMWGTQDATGVWRIVSGTYTLRNGSGWGALTNLAAQSIIQATNGDLFLGCNGNLYISEYPDEGQTAWMDIGAYVAGSPSWDITDFLETSNGDTLVSMNGAYLSGGGVWLSGNGGKAWMEVNQGFDSSTQNIEDIVSDSGTAGSVKYYASTDGSGVYTRTITPSGSPTLTSLSISSGGSSGGDAVTITGVDFSDSCPTGNASDCPVTAPYVWFGGTPVAATYVNSTTITVTTPAHSAGTVDVTVMNPDTRESSAISFAFTDDGSASPLLTVTKTATSVNLAWTPTGRMTIDRSTDVGFSAPTSIDLVGASWDDPDDVLGNSTTYYYRVTSK